MANSDSAGSLSISSFGRTSGSNNPTRNTRIRFPDQYAVPSSSSKQAHLRNSYITAPNSPVMSSADSSPNARLHPKDSACSTPESSPAKHASSRRKSRRSVGQNSGHSPLKITDIIPEYDSRAFSDEFDLSHENPQLLQDVQRALHFQSRRRDRKSVVLTEQAAAEATSSRPGTTAAAFPSASPVPSTASPQPTSPIALNAVLSSEVDFSPAIHAIPMHPVPVSSNGGATLDWTGSLSDEERGDRRWTLSISKRKGKDKAFLSPRSMLEKQEVLFADKVARIKAEAQPRTLRKAAIISEQLERRYATLGGSSATGKAVNLLGAARWYASLDEHVRKSLDEAEPLTWLKHLLDKSGRTRSQWYLSSLIVEEYMRNEGHPPSATISHKTSEASALPSMSGSTTLSPPTSPYHFVQSAPVSKQSFDGSLTRIRSNDDNLSFEPRVTSGRSSEDIERKDWNDPRRTHRRSLPGMFESHHAFATAFGASSSPAKQGEFSPTSSRLHVHDLLQRRRRKTYESDEGSSSFHSQSEDNSRRESTRSGRKKPKRPRPSASALQSPQESATEMIEDKEDASLLRRPSPPKASQSDEANPSTLDNNGRVGAVDAVLEKTSVDTPAAFSVRRKLVRRLSLVISERPSVEETRAQWNQEEEELLQRAYEEKSQLLGDIKAQNHRMRQRLTRIAGDVREYDVLRTELWRTLGVVHRSLPADLVDAFSHDPSSVTGHTRRSRGWRAVEDIHNRIQRQQETLDIFLRISQEDGIPHIESVLDVPISMLMGALQTLEKNEIEIREKSLEVAPMLEKVKNIHAVVKTQYNSTLSHVSALYPELSHIIALEESYKDQYQQVWELGMDALTFLLDTVAPFWRNYGKVIGVDIQDFLIIPLYRNEFTGEAKRYNIESLPRRSTRHWFALIFLFCLTIFVTLLQGRAAFSSTYHYNLTWIENTGLRWAIIPFFWIAIPIQWIAVIIEFFVVLMQLGVIAWWMLWAINVVT